jgi:RNA polymerase sigma-70 factor (ECF subfamily)
MTPVEAFAAAAAVEVTTELTVLVDAAIAACATAHPEIAIAPSAFAEYLGTRSRDAPPTDELLLDLHLAFAAGTGSAPAITRFESETLPAARAALRALRLDDSAIDEALQRMRDKLLVGAPPRVLEYRGEGRLRAWIRVVAIREHLMAQRGRNVEVSLDDAMLAAVPDPSDDPAIAVLRRDYRDDLATALTTAIAALDVRDRSLLRYSLVDGLDLGAIAAIFQTHKSTISRWLARARTRLWGLTRDSLIGPGGIDRADVESLVRAMRSGLDLSLARLLVET